MLRVSVDINGRPISTIAIVNMGGNQHGVNTYEIYECSPVAKGESVIEKGDYLGTVEHKYEDGAATLIQLAMEEIETFPD